MNKKLYKNGGNPNDPYKQLRESLKDRIYTKDKGGIEYIKVDGMEMPLSKYLTLVQGAMYTTSLEKEHNKKLGITTENTAPSILNYWNSDSNITPDMQEFESDIPKDQEWTDGKIIKLVPNEKGGSSRVQIGTYYISDGTDGYKKGTKVKGIKPVSGTVPRTRKTGGLKKYKKGGIMKKYQGGTFRVSDEASDYNLNNPYGYEPGSRLYNMYQRYLDMPYATRNIKADQFDPKLSTNTNFGFGPNVGGNLGINYNPSILNWGPDQNRHFLKNDGSPSNLRMRIGPSLSASHMFKNTPMQINSDLFNDYTGSSRLNVGLNQAIQFPLNKNRSLVAGGSGELGSAFGTISRSNPLIGDRTKIIGKDAVDYGMGSSGRGYAQGQLGLGYYPENSPFSGKVHLGAGSKLAPNPGLFYGGELGYGPLSLNIGKNQAGWTGGVGLNLPIGMGTNKRVGDPVRQKKGGMRMYQNAGMYGPNTLSAAGQGTGPQLGTTSTIVGSEVDPQLQQQRMQGLQQQSQALTQEANVLGQETQRQKMLDEQKAEQEAAQAGMMAEGKADAIAGQVGNIAQTVGSKLFPTQGGGVQAAAQAGQNIYRLQKAANIAQNVDQAANAAQLASKAGGTINAAGQVVDASGAVVEAGGSALGAGLKSFATSGAGLGTIASLAGSGISRLADDNDPTNVTTGEYIGSALEYGGKGATIGSFFPGPGTAIGAGIGTLYGIGKEAFGAKSAQTAQDQYEAESTMRRNQGIYDLNKRVGSLYGGHMSQLAAGNLAQKTISGQNLGRNIMYRGGGMMMRMPRYGYKL